MERNSHSRKEHFLKRFYQKKYSMLQSKYGINPTKDIKRELVGSKNLLLDCTSRQVKTVCDEIEKRLSSGS